MIFLDLVQRIKGKAHRELVEKRTIHNTFDVGELFFQHNSINGFLRYDMIVRLLTIENYFGKNDYGYDFYYRMQNARVGKERADKALGVFKALIKSYEEKGYDESSEIELDSNLNLIDGSHRMALAMYYKCPRISAKIRPYAKDIYYSIEWFYINGFSDEECAILKNKFQEVRKYYVTPFVCTLWHPARNYFQEITNNLSLFGKIVEIKDFTLEEWEYKLYTRGIYFVDDIADWKIEKKISYMMSPKSPLYSLRKVVLEIEEPHFRLKATTKNTLSHRCETIKRVIRDAYKRKVENYFHDTIMHIGDNFYQNKHIGSLLKENSAENPLILSVVNQTKGTLFIPFTAYKEDNSNSTGFRNNYVWVQSSKDEFLRANDIVKKHTSSTYETKIVQSDNCTQIIFELNGYKILQLFVVLREGRQIEPLNNKIPVRCTENEIVSDVSKFKDKSKLDYFNNILSKFKEICKSEGLDINQTCIVGSSTLSLLGLRHNHDIDFVVVSELRKKYGPKLYSFTDDIEMVAQNWARSNNRETISDDELINNPKNHFIYNGVKFASLNLLYERKKWQNRTKDLLDIWDIELFINKYKE